MMFIGYAAIAGVALVWAAARCPLGRAIALGMSGFAEASRGGAGSLD